MRHGKFLAVACALSLASCAGEIPKPLDWEEFKAQATPDGRGGFLVNGDELAEDLKRLRHYYDEYRASFARNFEASAPSDVIEQELTVNMVGGKRDVYSATQKKALTYCVSKATFGANYDRVVAAMNDAAAAWEAAADLNFIHVTAQDGNCTKTNTNVWFDVNQVTGQQYVAAAFFPSTARGSRSLLINTSAFGNMGVWTLTGVLRHELGHTLGWRHEHARWESWALFFGCPEGLFGGWQGVTSYDSMSVMHYPQCNGKQKGDLVLTAKDISGARSIYGAPAQ